MTIIFEGPDRCGKTEIAAVLAKQLGTTVFKNTSEWEHDIRDTDYFRQHLRYAATFMADFVSQFSPNVIFDRSYPSEWVYSKFFDRKTDIQLIEKIDAKYANANTKIIICRRKNYTGIVDDLHSFINEQALIKIDKLYEEFSKITKCRVITIFVDDHNIERQIKEINESLF